MSFILKTTEHVQGSPVASDNEHSLYADIVSVSFRREEGGAATAHVWMREPIKTADVPGFCEVEKFIGFTGVAYVMNEGGKTVSSFMARTSGDPRGPNASMLAPDRADYSDGYLRDAPYSEAALIRRNARRAGDNAMLARLDGLGVAVDA